MFAFGRGTGVDSTRRRQPAVTLIKKRIMGASHVNREPTSVLDRRFQATRWTVVLTAARNDGPASAEALQKLCAAYWYPLYAFIRKRGYTHAEAEDLTQGFFERLVEKEVLADLSRDGGRFRCFLLAAVKRFLANHWKWGQAQKRGGGKIVISIDETTDTRWQMDLMEQATPETLFERQWALAVLDRVYARLRDEYQAAGKGAIFDSLEDCLSGSRERQVYSEARKTLKMNEAALRVAAHRLRHRYGELLRSEIATTVSTPSEIDEELQYLIAAIGHH
jgi:DNA-directed RNA polymerase specialized sigma24 family protein